MVTWHLVPLKALRTGTALAQQALQLACLCLMGVVDDRLPLPRLFQRQLLLPTQLS
jgi:hypothetical protein